MGKKIGIDLGTTYSCVAYLNDNGGLEVVKNQEGNDTTPSVVFFDPDGQTVVVGEQARLEAAFAPENLVVNIKSQMGTKDYTINIMETEYSPLAISSIILRKLKQDAEAYFGDSIEGCVITCPAYFGTYARSAISEAAKTAGLNVYRIMDEPVAAAFAYAHDKNADINEKILIYDLGGGTFDCTLLKMELVGDQKKLNIIASGGDPFFGGMEWDKTLRDYAIEEFCRETGEDEDSLENDAECMVELSEMVEKIKKQLSVREAVRLPVVYNGNKHIVEITRETFDGITEHLLQYTIKLINDMLNRHNLSSDSFDKILLVGGSTIMPQVENLLMTEYGKPIIACNQDKLVAMGAALLTNDFTVSPQEQPRVADKSIGIKVNYSGKTQIVNLVIKGQQLFDSADIIESFDFSAGYGNDMIDRISITLIKNQSTQRFCDIDARCTEWAQVDFKLNEFIGEDSAINFKYSVANNARVVDTIKMVDRNGRTIGESKVVWKKRAFLGKAKQNEPMFDLSEFKLLR